MTDELDEAALEPEGEQDTTPESEPDELEKVTKAYESQKVRAEKAEKAAKALEAKLAQANKQDSQSKAEETSNEPDYAKLAFLETKGIVHPDDQKIIQDEAKRLKLPLTDILGMKHIVSTLKDAKDQREAEDGMPDSKGKPSGSQKTSIDYWLNRKRPDGTYDTPTDQELAGKVIEARLNKSKVTGKFSEDFF